ncbi:hypothetical protein JCM3775_006114 [Rhodotorula graminis]
MVDSLQPPLDSAAAAPTSPQPKTVSFDEVPAPPSASSSSSTAPGPSTSHARPANKRRRSSLKQGIVMPYVPPKELYSHRDPLLRRLRLRDSYAKPVDLNREFKDAKVVLFFFGATWRNSSREPFDLVGSFARRHPHQLKVVYVSVDQTEQAYEANTRNKPWLAMEWNDGSTMSTPDEAPDSPASPEASTPLEPYLLAGDPDLEEVVHETDPEGSLYLRPFSRVYLADKWTVLGVPNVVVYHVESQKVLTYHARFDLLKEGKADSTWDKWSKGEKVEFGVTDFLHALRWSIGLAVVASGYAVAVRTGYIDDVIGHASSKLTQNFLANR